MSDHAIVYHGTAKPFLQVIKRRGLVPLPGSPGVRVTTDPDEARRHARAWAAFVLYEERLVCEGMIVVAQVKTSQLFTTRERLRVRPPGILPGMFQIRGPLTFPEFGDPTAGGEGPAPGFFEALEEWEALTSRQISAPFPRKRARRS